MEASKTNPIYSVTVISSGIKFNLTPALISLSFSESKKLISKSVTIDLLNAPVGNSQLTAYLKVRDRVYIYANDGERYEEVWRGYIWTRSYTSDILGYNLTLKCYDNLIYFQESEESQFFAAGKSTKDIFSTLCGNWGVKLNYTYSSITHAKLALRGTLCDIFTSDLLPLVKDRTGKNYVIYSDQDTMYVKPVGSNTTVYNIKRGAGGTAMRTRSSSTLDGVTTKVVILGKADDDDRRPVEGTVTGNTSAYGTLQKIITRDENTTIEDAKKEAQGIIDDDGKPKKEYEVTAVDIPWIRKGDKVNVSAGDLYKQYIVVGIDREITLKDKRMTLTLEDV